MSEINPTAPSAAAEAGAEASQAQVVAGVGQAVTSLVGSISQAVVAANAPAPAAPAAPTPVQNQAASREGSIALRMLEASIESDRQMLGTGDGQRLDTPDGPPRRDYA